MIWVLYIVLTKSTFQSGISLHTQQFYTREECIRVGNILSNKLVYISDIARIKTLCVEQFSPVK